MTICNLLFIVNCLVISCISLSPFPILNSLTGAGAKRIATFAIKIYKLSISVFNIDIQDDKDFIAQMVRW